MKAWTFLWIAVLAAPVRAMGGSAAACPDDNCEDTSTRLVAHFSGLEAYASKDDKWSSAVKVSNFNQGVSCRDLSAEEIKAGTVHPCSNSVSFSKNPDALSPLLTKAVEARKPLKEVVIDVTSLNSSARYVLQDVTLTSVSLSFNDGDSSGAFSGSESVSLEAKKMTMTVTRNHQHSTVTLAP